RNVSKKHKRIQKVRNVVYAGCACLRSGAYWKIRPGRVAFALVISASPRLRRTWMVFVARLIGVRILSFIACLSSLPRWRFRGRASPDLPPVRVPGGAAATPPALGAAPVVLSGG
ncbi:hypothetical protein ACWEH1_21310, partial [Micromonospora chersina]